MLFHGLSKPSPQRVESGWTFCPTSHQGPFGRGETYFCLDGQKTRLESGPPGLSRDSYTVGHLHLVEYISHYTQKQSKCERLKDF